MWLFLAKSSRFYNRAVSSEDPDQESKNIKFEENNHKTR
jgi:hypothetical protein